MINSKNFLCKKNILILIFLFILTFIISFYSSTQNQLNLKSTSNSFSTENEIYYSNTLNPFIDEQIFTNSSNYYTQEFQVEEGSETINYYYENNSAYQITLILEQKNFLVDGKKLIQIL